MVPVGVSELESAVVQVRDGIRRGTGFFIASDLLVTCAHVARSASVVIETHSGRSIDGTVVERAPVEFGDGTWPLPDIALIEVSAPSTAVLDLALPTADVPHHLMTLGFTIGPADTPTLTGERPAFAGTEPLGRERVVKLTGCQLGAGMSGAPLLDRDTGQVVGIVKRTRDLNGALGGWAIPVSLLDKYFPRWVDPIRAARVATLLHAYLTEVIRRTETVEPRGMRRSRDAQDIVFPLDDVYLSLETRSFHQAELGGTSGRAATAAAKDPFLSIERFPEVPQPSEAASLERLMGDGRRTVVLGGPGSGKTTLLQWIALHTARACVAGTRDVAVARRKIDPSSQDSDLVILSTARVPIVARLADYHEACAAAGRISQPPTLREFLLSSATATAEDTSGHLSAHLSGLIDAGKTIILLDGMDELRDVSHRQDVRDAIAAFAVEVSGVGSDSTGADIAPQIARWAPITVATVGPTILVTSRHAGYRDAALGPAQFEHVVISPLSDEAVHRFLYNWNYAVRRWSLRGDDGAAEVVAEATRRADAIDGALRDRPSLRAIARTPLLLTVITLVHEELGRLPQQRADLLLEMGRILVERRATGHTFLDASDILGPVALWIHEHRATGLLTKTELQQQVRRHFDRLVVPDPRGGSVRAMADQFCADAEEQFGLIVERGAELVGFQHRMLQEFFAALEITSWSDDPFAAIEDRLFDPQWREVVIFVVCLETKASSHRGRRLIARLLNSGRSAALPLQSARRALFLGAECLAEVERSLPEAEVAVIHDLVEIVCGSSVTSQAPDVVEAVARLRVLAPLLPHAVDLVVTDAVSKADVLRRRALCELVSSLHIAAPGLRTVLELGDAAPGVGLVERSALLSLAESRADDDRLNADPKGQHYVPSWGVRVTAHLSRYGSSQALTALRQLGARPALGTVDPGVAGYEAELQHIVETQVGIEVILAASSLLILVPEALPRLLEVCVSRGLVIEANELLLWSAINARLPADALDRWRDLDVSYRLYALALAERTAAKPGAQALAWAQVELCAERHGAKVPEDEALGILSALTILSAGGAFALTAERFAWLDKLGRAGPDTFFRVNHLMSLSSIPAAVVLPELRAASPSGRRLVAVAAAERGQLTGPVLSEVIAAADDPSGLWRRRTNRVLSAAYRYSELDEDTVQMLKTLAHAETSLGTTFALSMFVTAMTFDAPGRLAAELQDGTLEDLFTKATPEVDALLLARVFAGGADAPPAVNALNSRRNQGGARTLPLVDIDSTDLARLIASGNDDEALLAGGLVARLALESTAAADVMWTRFGAGVYSPVASLELALWASEYQLGSGEQLADSASRSLETWPGAVGLAVAARLQSRAPDHGFALLRRAKLSHRDMIEGLLLAGDHPVVWSYSVDQPAMRGLSSLVGDVCAAPAALESLVAACALTMRSGCEWPRARFALHQLVQMGSRAPDAMSALSQKYRLHEAVTPYLANRLSFGVRMRAFATLAHTGRLTEAMFGALVAGVHDSDEVLTRVFEALRYIRAVDDSVVPLMQEALSGGGLAAVAALDTLLQLVHSYAFEEEASLRIRLVESLVNSSYAQSPWEVCRLPSGVAVLLRAVMMSATFRLLATSEAPMETRPIMLARRPSGPRDPAAMNPAAGFAAQFLERVRRHLFDGTGQHAQN
jgi:Trypsin-like peptidase domain/NACHT domain